MIKLEKGFTIIELVVVIAVIGVIILLTAPRFLDKVYESKLLMIKTESKNVSDLLTLELLHKNNEKIFEGRVAEINKDNLLSKQENTSSIENKIFLNGNNSYLNIQLDNLADFHELNRLLSDQEKGGLYKLNKNRINENIKSKLEGTFFANLNGEIYYLSLSDEDFMIDIESKEFTSEEAHLGLFNDIYKMIEIGDLYNAKNKIQNLSEVDQLILNDKLEMKYKEMQKSNLGTLYTPKAWNKALLTELNDEYKVNFNPEVDKPGGFGIITDRNKTWNITTEEEYIILFELKSEDMKTLKYNYIISDSGNKVLPHIPIIKENEWNKITMKITSKDKDRTNTGILIGGDTRHINSGSEFEIRNVVVSKIYKP